MKCPSLSSSLKSLQCKSYWTLRMRTKTSARPLRAPWTPAGVSYRERAIADDILEGIARCPISDNPRSSPCPNASSTDGSKARHQTPCKQTNIRSYRKNFQKQVPKRVPNQKKIPPQIDSSRIKCRRKASSPCRRFVNDSTRRALSQSTCGSSKQRARGS